jgi:hypothetical protein
METAPVYLVQDSLMVDFGIPQSLPAPKRFTVLVQKLTGIEVGSEGWQERLTNWIAQNPGKWWRGVWVACEIKGEPGEVPAQAASPADIFSNARINIAENILGFGPRMDPALIGWAEDGPRQRWNRARLKEMAGRFASAFYALGLQSGDSVVLHLPDTPEKIAAFLGASWMGLRSIIEPVWTETNMGAKNAWAAYNPKLILSCDGYRRDSKWTDQGDLITELASQKQTETQLVVVPCAGSKTDVQNLDGVFPWERFESLGKGGGRPYQYVGFDHPLALLWQRDGDFTPISSGDWLLEQIPRWRLHVEIDHLAHLFAMDISTPDEWLNMLAALATGSDLVALDGLSTAMNGQIYWRIMEREAVKVLQVSARAARQILVADPPPTQNHLLTRLELILIEGELEPEAQARLGETCFPDIPIQEL